MAKALNELVEVVLKTIEVATVLLAACFCTLLPVAECNSRFFSRRYIQRFLRDRQNKLWNNFGDHLRDSKRIHLCVCRHQAQGKQWKTCEDVQLKGERSFERPGIHHSGKSGTKWCVLGKIGFKEAVAIFPNILEECGLFNCESCSHTAAICHGLTTFDLPKKKLGQKFVMCPWW